jgi:hypothetical protein
MTIKEQFWEDWETLLKNTIVVYIGITKNEVEKENYGPCILPLCFFSSQLVMD